MSRLIELEERGLVGMLARIKAQHADLKSTPQPTSVKSGVRTYQIPEGNLWNEFEVYRKINGTEVFIGKHRHYMLPGTGGVNTPDTFNIITEFFPENQKSPVVYPYLVVSVDGHSWEPIYDPSIGLAFAVKDPHARSHVFSGWYLKDSTNYRSRNALKFLYVTNGYYDTPDYANVELKIRFMVRSTDKGKIKIKVVLDD
jgi:hypothetical protein|nr:MAG TPA: hypothetical protein [Caudoviricetes sp.]